MNVKNIDEILQNLKKRRSVLENILNENNIPFGNDSDATSAFRTECDELKKLKVAAVMDAFTLGNFKSECNLMQITADNWREEMESFAPDLFFLESAWEGKDKSWYKKVANGSKELYDLTNYCHEKGIPVIFWNKEDPVYTDTFISAASCADFVFTTDFDCINRYKRTLQHNNVYLLHFSAQPQVHNPGEMHDRKDKFCFAGAYYHRYKDRSRVFDAFADVFEKGKGLDIYDRNLGSARPEHAFPQRYNKMIVGNLKPEDIHIAYKGYNYGINMNSVNQSQTMFARRVYELLASNTVSVGNYSRGTKNLFGDLTICTDSADAMEKHLHKYCYEPEDYRKYRLLGLRKVLRDNLCEDRLGFIAKCVFNKEMRRKMPDIYVLSDNAQNFLKQTYENKYLASSFEEIPDDAFVAVLNNADYYGENYLLDLALSVRYSSCDGFGKVCYYENTNGEINCNDRDCTYKKCDKLAGARSIIKKSAIADKEAYLAGEEISGDFFCTDEFNYCKGFNGEKCDKVDDLFVADHGISHDEINNEARKTDYIDLDEELFRITPSEMLRMCDKKTKNVDVIAEGGKFIINSKLENDQVVYLEFSQKFNVRDFDSDNRISVTFQCTGDLNTENFCIFYDSAMKKTEVAKSAGNSVLSAEIPSDAEFMKFSVRIRGSGSKEFSGIVAGGDSKNNSVSFLSRSNTVIVADNYPAYDDLYKYMFVHKRNSIYKENGLVTDMLRINMWAENRYREFEGINVTEGNADKLAQVLDSGRIKTVCVHFLNPYLWSVLKNYLDEINLIIWSHGSDIQPWHRRKFNLKTQKDIEEAQKASAIREELWKEVFDYAENYNIRFVYVSEFFKKQIEEDYNVSLDGKCSIIHNCIDTDMFSYEKKTPEQRFSIMSVKSFSTLTYANDITQQAILELSKEPEFSKLTFDLYGDGERFETDTQQLKKFSNVHLHRGFLTQSEIAKLHKSHGIYIATTRMDTQGVSRDEAMSSGLVPVASAVAAIPEFVDESCGMLVPGEDAKAVADAILRLVRDENLFMKLSENAAMHVRNKTSKKYTIDEETSLIKSMQ